MKTPRTSRPSRWANGPSPENRTALTQVMRGAAERLFSSLDPCPSYTGTFPVGETRWRDPLSALPFTGREVAGTLLFAAPMEFLSRTTPTGDQEVEDLLDWSREVANLLVGSLKTGLLKQGIVIELGIPTSFVGDNVRVALPNEAAVGLLFESGDHEVRVVLDAYVEHDVRIRTDEESRTSFDIMML